MPNVRWVCNHISRLRSNIEKNRAHSANCTVTPTKNRAYPLAVAATHIKHTIVTAWCRSNSTWCKFAPAWSHVAAEWTAVCSRKWANWQVFVSNCQGDWCKFPNHPPNTWFVKIFFLRNLLSGARFVCLLPLVVICLPGWLRACTPWWACTFRRIKPCQGFKCHNRYLCTAMTTKKR